MSHLIQNVLVLSISEWSQLWWINKVLILTKSCKCTSSGTVGVNDHSLSANRN